MSLVHSGITVYDLSEQTLTYLFTLYLITYLFHFLAYLLIKEHPLKKHK